MSRRRRKVIIALSVAVLAALVFLDKSCIYHSLPGRGESETPLNDLDFEKYHAKKFNVVKVVDGDTLDIAVPDGKYEHTRIRLWGVDTPETKSTKHGQMYFGPEAAEFTKKLTIGKKVTVYLDEGNNTRGKYGRLLAYVYLADGSILNELLLTEGFAYADLRFRHSYYNKYKQLESLARGQNKGLWKEVTREQLPQWLQKKKTKLLQEK